MFGGEPSLFLHASIVAQEKEKRPAEVSRQAAEDASGTAWIRPLPGCRPPVVRTRDE